eukprot:TRINITY_DN1931_c0_g1_i1.p1 TRINITY_DN1931_c0_g1~~TRINITY_DN1931_c0_g1_i1.p1  ORF type:complete len:842 (+),score=152.69 TRINITY_DN1931_c0_g1_i1:2003-4528(+)
MLLDWNIGTCVLKMVRVFVVFFISLAGYVCIRNSMLLSGNLGKTTLGGSMKGLIFVLIRDLGPKEAAEAMIRLTRMCTRWLTNHGFSIGIEDVTPSCELSALKEKMLDQVYDQCDSRIQDYNSGKLTPLPGCDEEESLESMLNGALGQLREGVGKMCAENLPFENAPRIMADCGSKGSTLNICQMIACVGQQQVSGRRVYEGFVDRTLPLFPLGSKEPNAKGFVANSFYTGLTGPEFFFHTMAGREGLVDTAVKTAETGYMQRRLTKALEDLSQQYDGTVRSSGGDLFQFTYGDDGLDPVMMESTGRPVLFDRVLMKVRSQFPDLESPVLCGQEINSIIHAFIATPAFQELLPEASMFEIEIREFGQDVFSKMKAVAERVGLLDVDFDSLEPSQCKEEHFDSTEPWTQFLLDNGSRVGSSGWTKSVDLTNWWNNALQEGTREWIQEGAAIVNSVAGVTRNQLQHFLKICLRKYRMALMHAGEACGAIAAHSLGEPATQMTLKTFHFAGVASMNVTLGVPRITEIINATAKISTPIIQAVLQNNSSEIAARVVKGRVERTSLGEICESMKEVYDVDSFHLALKLDMETIHALRLEINADTVRQAILDSKIDKDLKETHVAVTGQSSLIIRAPGNSLGDKKKDSGLCQSFYTLQTIKNKIPGVIVQGIKGVTRAVISCEERNHSQSFKLLVEGTDLLQVMVTPGIDGLRTTSNDIVKVSNVLGIEAARSLIIREVSYTYGNYGMDIDRRHLFLLGDVMTAKGAVLGIQRSGIQQMKDSVLMLASFEKTSDHLFNAAVHGQRDSVEGVSECIIMGIPIPLGTGRFKVLRESDVQKIPKRKTICL